MRVEEQPPGDLGPTTAPAGRAMGELLRLAELEEEVS
jgi:hypothetical protein